MNKIIMRLRPWLLTTLLLALLVTPFGASGNTPDRSPLGQSDFVDRFKSGDPSTGAMFRWWWPGSAVDESELIAEVDAIADAGYKGVEIVDSMDSVNWVVDPDEYGYGIERWNNAIKAVLNEAKNREMQVDLTLGAHWPPAVPGLDVNGAATSKELTYGFQLVKNSETFSGTIPTPTPKTYADRISENGVITTEMKTSAPQFIAVSALRCLEDTCATKPFTVTLGSQIDLTSQVISGTLTWTPPDNHNWVLVSYWYRGTAQRNDAPFGNTNYLFTDPESRVIDHFSQTGAQAFIDYFNTLLDAESRELLAQIGGAFFEDSLELTFAQPWTPDFLTEFQERRGYSLTPYLPFLAKNASSSPFGSPSAFFKFEGTDATVNTRVTRDVQQTLNDLYLEKHVAPMKTWANSLGLKYRVQPYGQPIDLAQASAALDISECESLGCGTTDDWRLISSGTEMAGRAVVSDELLPGGFNGAYGTTQKDVVKLVNSHYAVGANLMIFHGFNYATWPGSADGAIIDDYTRWPGFHSFSANIGEPFGPRQPTWTMARDTSGYYARSQLVLQSGKLKTDVAIYNQSLNHISSAYGDASLLNAGYSYGYVTPGSLTLPTAKITGDRLAADGPAYKALIINNQSSMPLAAARKIYEFARSGFPIIIVGTPPSTTPGYAATAIEAYANDEVLQEIISLILNEENVHQVAATADVPATLTSLGVTPAASSTASNIQMLHRTDDDVDYYFLYNKASTPVTGTVTLSAQGNRSPFILNAWTGLITPLMEYTKKNDRISTTISLEAGAATIIAIAPSEWAGDDIPNIDIHVTATSADEVRWEDGRLVARVSSTGTFSATLSNGWSAVKTITELPAPIDLMSWDLAVDEYQPGTTGDSSNYTKHVNWTFNDIALTSWQNISEITDAIGVGTYSTEVTLPADWSSQNGAYLNLGTVYGSFQVKVNGQSVGVADQLGNTVDIGPYLTAGANTIEVKIATTMINRLRVFRVTDYGSRTKQDYGLVGPVQLIPYQDATIWTASYFPIVLMH